MTPPPEQLVITMTVIELGGLAVVSVVGLVLLWRLWSNTPDVPAERAERHAYVPS
jgi:hypothetical protein